MLHTVPTLLLSLTFSPKTPAHMQAFTSFCSLQMDFSNSNLLILRGLIVKITVFL